MNLVARGVGETYAVFLLPLGNEFGWSRGELTSVYSIYMAMLGLSAPVGGWVFDRFGPRASYGLGLGCLALGFFGASNAGELWHLYVCIGVVCGFGATAMGLVTSSALVSRWFRSRLGTAMGVTYAGLNSGVILLAPLAQITIDNVGWRQTYTLMSIALATLLLPVLALPWRRLAAGHPDFPAVTPSTGARTHEHHDRARRRDWTLAEAIRQSAFWGLFAVFFFTAIAIYAVSLQIVAYLVEAGFTPLQAATAFGLAGTLSVGGMASAGWMSDRIGRRATVGITFSLTISGIVAALLHRPASVAGAARRVRTVLWLQPGLAWAGHLRIVCRAIQGCGARGDSRRDLGWYGARCGDRLVGFRRAARRNRRLYGRLRARDNRCVARAVAVLARRRPRPHTACDELPGKLTTDTRRCECRC